jgi:integrase
MADKQPRPRLTTKLIKDTAAPAAGAIIVWDGDLPGFGCRISSRGVRTFFLNYRADGWERRYKIGRAPAWTAERARREAEELRRRIDLGEDPVAQKRERREAPTIADLVKRYVDDHLPSMSLEESGRRGDEMKKLEIITATLGARTPVADIHYGDIAALHKKVTQSGRPIRANRILAVASAMFTLASRPLPGENEPWRTGDNPCRGIKRNPEVGRERFFSEAELAALSDALKTIKGPAADCIRLLMLTGARPCEALRARWAEFDTEPNFWVKPSAHTKQRRTHKLALGPPVLELMRRLRAERDPDCAMVFPPRWQGGAKVNLRPLWSAARERASVLLWGASDDPRVAEVVADLRAGLKREPSIRECREEAGRRELKLPTALMDARPYDLRHTFASCGASGGLSLPVIGRLLGHTQSSTTAKYAHLSDDSLRRAANQVAEAIANAGRGGVDADNIAAMRKKPRGK